jgi:hypothetical protein
MGDRRRARGIAGLVAAGGLLTGGSGWAAVYTVGPGGTHGSIQAAIDDALGGSGSDEVRIAQGTYFERIRVGEELGVGQLTLSGGWDAAFALRSRDERTTILDGGGSQDVILLNLPSGKVRVTGLTVTGTDQLVETGGASRRGAISIELSGMAEVRLVDLLVRDNRLRASGEGSALGVGLSAVLRDDAELVVLESTFQDNSASEITANTQGVAGGGALILGLDRSRVEVRDCDFLRNEVAALGDSTAYGGGLSLQVTDTATAFVLDNLVADNLATATLVSNGGLDLTASYDGADGGARLVAARNRLLRNRSLSSFPGAQLQAIAYPFSEILVSDSLIAEGEGRGVLANAWADGRLHLTNLTVTGHGGNGLWIQERAGGEATLSNSISWNNESPFLLDGAVALSHNLGPFNPRFVNAAAGDYRLRFGSPAIDAGDDLPPGGLGPADLDLAARRQGAHVDMGAYEASADRGGDLPVCRVLGAPDPPASPDTNVCTCLRNPDLRAYQCEFFLPGFIAGLRLPFDFAAGGALRADWALLPRSSVAGPYGMRAAAEVDGQWVAQAWLGPKADKLVLDRSVVEPFRIKPAYQGRTPLRTELRWKSAGGWRTEVLEVLLPEAVKPAP